jgi:hypothetical protein
MISSPILISSLACLIKSFSPAPAVTFTFFNLASLAALTFGSNPGIPRDSLVNTFSPFNFLATPTIIGDIIAPPTALAAACLALLSNILSSST